MDLILKKLFFSLKKIITLFPITIAILESGNKTAAPGLSGNSSDNDNDFLAISVFIVSVVNDFVGFLVVESFYFR
jgi:hypothetical protein